jgi:kynurenine formamidase
MCLPACTIQLAEAISRRTMMRSVGAAAGATAFGTAASFAAERAEPALQRVQFSRVIDLTHTLSDRFPMPWQNGFSMERVSTLGKDQWNAYRWHFHEHIGTHLDAPLHFSELDSADRIPASQLVGPLAVVDIRERASGDPDTTLTLDDLKSWEQRHGRIPEGAIIALYSGWESRVDDRRKFFGLDEKGGFHLPGFHLEAVQFLQEDRNVKGIASDTMSLDTGIAAGFPVHHFWLGHKKWGLENVANLGQVPPTGATIVVGSPKVAGCTGGPSRVFALV